MESKKANVHRRKWRRHKITGGAVVMVKKPRWIEIGKPHLVPLGPVVDISLGGLAMQYINTPKRAFESDALAISLPSEGLKVDPIPFRVVSDVEVSRLPDGKAVHNRCVEFGKLNDYQTFQLQSFIDNHSAATHRDRRCGMDRRQFVDPRFEDDGYRAMYERRFEDDRRG